MAVEPLDAYARQPGSAPIEAWGPVALHDEGVRVTLDDKPYLFPWARIKSAGTVRRTSTGLIRAGLLLYLVSFVPLVLKMPIVAVVLVCAGGVVTVAGYFQRSLVLLVADKTVPPVVVPHAKAATIARRVNARILGV